MIKALSAVISDWLLKEGAVESSEKGLFEYAAYSLFFGFLPVIIIIVLGSAFSMLYEGLMMIVPFMLIRKFSGGYHLNSPIACFFTSTTILAGALILVAFITNRSNTVHILSGVTLAACTSIFFCSPIDSSARRLSEKEKKVFRYVARTMVLIAVTVYFVLCSLNHIRSAVPIAVSIIVVAVLQLPCIVLSAIKYHGKAE